MSIRTKLRISAGITIGFALIIALTAFAASRNIEQAASQDRFGERVIKDVSDLNSLSYVYLSLQGQRFQSTVADQIRIARKSAAREHGGQ